MGSREAQAGEADGQNGLDPDAAAAVRAFAAMPDLADAAVAYRTRRTGAAPPAPVVQQLRASARRAFDPALLRAQLPEPVAPDAAAGWALAHFDAAAARLATTLRAGPEAGVRADAEAAEARLAARADRGAIVALAEVMPAPARAAERAVTLRRMLAALGAVAGGVSADLRAADAATLESGVAAMIADSRRPAVDHADGLPTLAMQEEAARGAARRALLELAPAEIAALTAHYDSPAGRARRQLVVAALEVADDQAGRAMLLGFLAAVRRLPPDAPR